MDIHNEGRAAFYEGVKATCSPYADCDLRSHWVKGWYDAEHDYLVTEVTDAAPAYRFRADHRIEPTLI
jgi:ribosome modulation factor